MLDTNNKENNGVIAVSSGTVTQSTCGIFIPGNFDKSDGESPE